ncbi:MAG: hypothetical protein K8T91_15885 [Planctomycetes bacterium]|nr:hypothetical protein [Planctomycetota bacterium]
MIDMSTPPLNRRMLLAALLLSLSQTGCHRDSSANLETDRQAKPALRTASQITAEQANLPKLYLTQKTHRQVVAEGNADVVIDPQTGELAFRTWICRNPDCPGRKPGGEPVQFICYDPLYYVKPDGSVDYKIVQDRIAEITRLGGTPWPLCPECLKVRNLANETQEEQRKYVEFCVEYVLPESERRMKELEAEYVHLITKERERRESVK